MSPFSKSSRLLTLFFALTCTLEGDSVAVAQEEHVGGFEWWLTVRGSLSETPEYRRHGLIKRSGGSFTNPLNSWKCSYSAVDTSVPNDVGPTHAKALESVKVRCSMGTGAVAFSATCGSYNTGSDVGTNTALLEQDGKRPVHIELMCMYADRAYRAKHLAARRRSLFQPF